MIKSFDIDIEHRSGHNGNVNGGLFGVRQKVYVSRPEVIESFALTKDEYCNDGGYLGYQESTKEGILNIDMDVFDDKKDWVVVESIYNQQQEVDRKTTKTILGEFTPFPQLWEEWVINTVYKSEEFARRFRYQDEEMQKLVEYYLRKTAKGTIIDAAIELAEYLGVTKEFRYNWIQVYYQKIYLLRQVARRCGQLRQFDEYVGWYDRPEYFDFKQHEVKPAVISKEAF